MEKATNCAVPRSIFDLCLNEEPLQLKEVNPLLKDAENPELAAEWLEDKIAENDRPVEGNVFREVSGKMVCLACKCHFINREEQREHYRLDWHRFNLRQKMAGLPPLTADEFEGKTGAGDLSSISGSESDSEESTDSDSVENSRTTGNDNISPTESNSIIARLSSKIVFLNSAGEFLSVYRCVLQRKSDDTLDAVLSLRAISKQTVWVVLLTGGGHFAGAVFEGKEVLQHKTFHRYTVRAKRGTAQGLRDSQNRSHTPKSAGAALRRYNEAALVKDIQDLLVSWDEYLSKASAIFVRAPSYNKTIFFSGRGATLDKKDPRIRTLPFPTRRATFREVQRVHEMLSTVQVFGKGADLSAAMSPPKKGWKKCNKPTVERITGKEKVQFEREKFPNKSAEEEDREESDGEETQLEMVELTIGTLDLRESETYPSRHKKRKRKKKTKNQNMEITDAQENDKEEEQPDAEPAAKTETKQVIESIKNKERNQPSDKQIENAENEESLEYGMRDKLFTACKIGDVNTLCSLLNQPESNISSISSPIPLLNKSIDSSGFTLLHVAAAAAQKEVINLLLDAGADPACRDNKFQTPYIVAPDKDTRNVFRKYMGENPEKYDYKKAQIPEPLTAEIESKKLEKKKALKAQKKLREKEQKEEKRKQELEAEEKRKFAALTDREKRALAAERRLAQQVAAEGKNFNNVTRCWSCGESLLGKVPFQYLEYSFCTPRCVQAHRKANIPLAKTYI